MHSLSSCLEIIYRLTRELIGCKDDIHTPVPLKASQLFVVCVLTASQQSEHHHLNAIKSKSKFKCKSPCENNYKKTRGYQLLYIIMRTALLDELLCNEKLLCLFCLFYFSSFSAFIVTWIWLPDFNTVLAMFPNVCGVIAFITASKPLALSTP